MKFPVYQGRRLSSLTLGVLVLACVGAVLTMPTHLKNSASCVAYPLLCMQRACVDMVNTMLVQRSTACELEHTIRVLRAENDALMGRIIEHEATAHYAKEIEELVAFKQRYALDNALCAQILTKSFSDQAHFFLVDAGSLQGVQADMIAVYNNVLLGRVVEVYPQYSKIILVSDRGCKVAAYCAQTGASGIYEGCNSITQASLSRISHLETVEENDLVISSGQGLVFPQGFALGRTATVSRNELFHIVAVAPLLDISQLSYCMLITRDMVAAQQ